MKKAETVKAAGEVAVVKTTAGENIAAGLAASSRNPAKKEVAAAAVAPPNAPIVPQEDMAAMRKRLDEFEAKDKQAAEQRAAVEAVTKEGQSGEDVAALKKRLDEFEAKEKVTTERRAAEDFTTDFIRSDLCKPFPAEMLRKMLPVSSDAKILTNALVQIGKWVEGCISYDLASGRLSRNGIGTGDVGGASRDGGTPPSRAVSHLHGSANTPYSNISEGLRGAQRQTVVSLQHATQPR